MDRAGGVRRRPDGHRSVVRDARHLHPKLRQNSRRAARTVHESCWLSAWILLADGGARATIRASPRSIKRVPSHPCARRTDRTQTIARRRGGAPSVVVERAMEEERYYDTKEEPQSPDYEGKIKACGTVASRCDRLSCLHIGLSTAPTVPMADGLARQVRRSPALRAAFPQCPRDLPPGSPRPPGT